MVHLHLFGDPHVLSCTLHRDRIFGAPLGGTRQGVTVVQANDHTTPNSPSKETKLHALVERGDADAVQEFFRNEQDTATGKFEEPPELQETTPPMKATAAAVVVEGSNIIVDTPCPRTGMTPLLKAVEGSSEAVVRVLLEAGADVRRQVRTHILLSSFLPANYTQAGSCHRRCYNGDRSRLSFDVRQNRFAVRVVSASQRATRTARPWQRRRVLF